MEELKRTIAVLFKRKGSDTLTEKDFILSASMGLRWFTPGEAKKLLNVGIETKTLTQMGDIVSPNFDYKSISIPLGFQPDKRILELKKIIVPCSENLFLQIVDKISEKTGSDRREIVSRINKKQERMSIEIEVVGLLVARECDVDITDFIGKVEKEIIERAKEESVEEKR